MLTHAVTMMFCLLLAAGCASRETCSVAVVDSLAPIRAAFNANADRPRVLLLVSPTCSECVFGAEAVRASIMDRFSASGVFAVVVWEPFLEPDNEASARRASGIFAGVPATQFYDPERLSGWAYEREHFTRKWEEVDAALPADHWLRAVHDRKPQPAPEWDVYMLYRPGVRWEDRTPRPDAFIRHIGRDEQGCSRYWRDTFNAPPTTGDLHEAMERMGSDVLGSPRGRGGRGMTIELLGFPDCPNTPALRDNLRAALKTIGGGRGGLTFRDVNQKSLPDSDPRRGWPAPTILVNNTDLFGMAPPTDSSMGCRRYEGGVPDAASIAARLLTITAPADVTWVPRRGATDPQPKSKTGTRRHGES